MAFAYTINNQAAVHFVTFTVHQWTDVFTRQYYVDCLLNSVEYCQKEKGLEVYAWVVMSNHCHFIVRAKNENLSDIIRDLKKFTSKNIYKAIEENQEESRKNWLLKLLKYNDKYGFEGKTRVLSQFCAAVVIMERRFISRRFLIVK